MFFLWTITLSSWPWNIFQPPSPHPTAVWITPDTSTWPFFIMLYLVCTSWLKMHGIKHCYNGIPTLACICGKSGLSWKRRCGGVTFRTPDWQSRNLDLIDPQFRHIIFPAFVTLVENLGNWSELIPCNSKKNLSLNIQTVDTQNQQCQNGTGLKIGCRRMLSDSASPGRQCST